MLLAVDIGNSNVVLGLLAGHEVTLTARLPTLRDELAGATAGRLREALRGAPLERVRAAIVASVIPSLAAVWATALRETLNVPVRVVDHATDTGVRLSVDHPEQVGADRYVNLAALVGGLAKTPGVGALVVDCGTATTFDVLAPNGDFLGGAIAPGMAVAAEALTSRAPRLPPVPLEAPPRAVAANTVDAIRSGVVFGYAGLVEGIVARMRRESAFPLRVYATGGLGATVAAHCTCFDVVDPDLTLRGLACIHARLEASR
jgi:type III pantothenate kinase